MTEDDFTEVQSPIEINVVWRTITGSPITGWYVWDVIQVVGEVYAKDAHMYLPTLDNEFIMIQCYHFFTQAKAKVFLNSEEFYQSVNIV